MAYFGVTASEAGLSATPGAVGGLEDALAPVLAVMPPHAPVVVLIHGYKFDPRHPESDPHRLIYAREPSIPSWKVVSWPERLGIGAHGRAGLCIGFAWPATEPHLPSLLATGRTGFAEVYHRAGDYGERLAALLALIARLAPGRPVDLLAHSLGARVALAALPHLGAAPGRIVLLGAAEFDTTALAFLQAAPTRPQVYNVTARANDLYDLLFESLAPRQSRRQRAVGLGLDPRPQNWLDLQIDRADVTAWVNAQGIPLAPANARLCHWSFYTRQGAFALYRTILDRAPGWDIASLRTKPCFAAQEPRWSRLLPRGRLPRAQLDTSIELGSGLTSA